MPNVTVPKSNYTKDDQGFEFLEKTYNERCIEITGTTIGSSCEIKFKDDEGVLKVLATVADTDLPFIRTVPASFRKNLEIDIQGTPNCNISGSNDDV